MDTLVFRECPDLMVLLVTLVLLEPLDPLVPEALLVPLDLLERMVDPELTAQSDPLVTVVPLDMLDLLDLPDLLVFPDPLVPLVVPMTSLVASMSTLLTRLPSGPRTTRLMPPSSH